MLIYWNDLIADLPTGLEPMKLANPDDLMRRAFGMTLLPIDKRNAKTVICIRANDGSKAEVVHADFQEFNVIRAAEPVRVGDEMQQTQHNWDGVPCKAFVTQSAASAAGTLIKRPKEAFEAEALPIAPTVLFDLSALPAGTECYVYAPGTKALAWPRCTFVVANNSANVLTLLNDGGTIKKMDGSSVVPPQMGPGQTRAWYLDMLVHVPAMWGDTSQAPAAYVLNELRLP
ncbi:hypothetical protein JD974_04395 [Chromobacterium haemolyticum]|uniref:Uncharacterized protein n=1 Tax=Chromobacterium haemolyticum TaxID=394935 RepID=A0ABS3GJI4_9NEIS|nr:hypothetical protein [Chromobacterium haemolyticum]MBK0413640.1 hypothetical protein [Chromobacterium haemolyticum]MBO0414742.1 hypothetical protein [Chromobacterium haemolyticum]MBO0498003.1 hypothetical protein [Chromobacterium haemolyticum]